jgi:uncharacterized membrane protein YbaN (DUF454 family)
MKVIALQITGYAFLVLGVLGLFLPFLQGVLFLLIGLLILAKNAPWAHTLLERLRARYPKVGGLIETAETTMMGWWDRIVRFFSRSDSRSG